MTTNTQIERLYFIGDIHGQQEKLAQLLDCINFKQHQPAANVVRHQLVFIGDLIDNAPGFRGDHIALLNQVKTLIDQKHAHCILGNHEFNAIGWALKKANGSFLRPHTDDNYQQHQAFLEAVGEDSLEHQHWINWFKKLPIFLDFSTVRAIHACWNNDVINAIQPYLNEDNSLKEAHWHNAFNKQHELCELCETLLKGPEQTMPAGQFFVDKTGKKRTKKRIEWWHDYHLQTNAKPVLIGHYTLNGRPAKKSKTVVCVDYNAAKEDNPLVAYEVCLSAESATNFGDECNFHYINKTNYADVI
jgi:hypothetical protein